MTLLEAIDLAIGYPPRREVLAGVSMRVTAGELICVLGPNGAGKSTLLRTLAGMQDALAGRVELRGRPLGDLAPRELARQVGVVLPERVSPGLLTAADLVALGRYPHTDWLGRLRSEDERIVDRALLSAGVAHLAERDVSTLSDGERQKVMIARALAQEPAVMILDEPTAFLDLPGRVEILGLLARLARPAQGEEGTPERAVVLSTHDLDLALRTADRVWLLDDGGNLACGAPEDLVLSGAFEAAFETESVRFDAAAGSFRAASHPAGSVVLRGGGIAAQWTRRALERVGIRVVNAEAAPGAPTVEVAGEDGGYCWKSTVDEAVREHASIEELLTTGLRKPEGDRT